MEALVGDFDINLRATEDAMDEMLEDAMPDQFLGDFIKNLRHRFVLSIFGMVPTPNVHL